jgi:septum formation protein
MTMNLSFRPQNIPPEERPIQVILASQSIGRKSLLEKLGIIFRTLITHVDEEAIVNKDPYKTIKARAEAKAQEVIKNPRLYNLPIEGRVLIIAADSMAVLGTTTYGRTQEKDETKAQLKALMGKTHIFATAVSIQFLNNGIVKKSWESLTKTKVTMKKMGPTEVDEYVSRYDFARFAAGYSINEAPWDLIKAIDGSYTNVIGLPFEELLPILRKLEIIK